MIALDASVLIAFFNSRDRHHEAACDLLGAHATRPLLASPITLAEFYVGPARAGRVQAAQQQITALGVQPAVIPDSFAVDLAALRVTSGLKLPDCCVLLGAINSGAALATFDADLGDAARTQGIDVLR